MSRLRALQTALESVDFQKSRVFFDELSLAVSELRKLPKVNRNAVEVAGITKVIFHHTGINLDGVYFNDVDVEMVAVPIIDPRSPLITYMQEGLRVQSHPSDGVDRSLIYDLGTVDLVHGRVTGVFSKVRSEIYLGSVMFNYMTDREIAACILHEVGHLFAMFEYMSHTATLAVNLNYCASQLTETNDKEQRVKIIINAVKNLGTTIDNVEELALAKDPKIPLTIIMENYTRKARSGVGSDFYDYRSWEALADQFATRQGAGRDLVTGLDKMARRYGGYAKKGTFMDVLNYTASIVGWGAALVASITYWPLALVIGGLVGYSLTSPFPPEGKYDNPTARLTRVKNELVGALKDSMLPLERQKSLQADIAAVDEIIAKIGKEDSFFNILWRAMTPYRRDNYRQIQLQQDLEKLANNELFLAASKLNTLAAH